MALFKRQQLRDKGLTDEQIEFLMTESSRALAADYVPKGTPTPAPSPEPPQPQPTTTPMSVTDTPEYKELLAKSQKLEAYGTKDFEAVKTPYRDIVWDKLDHSEKHKPYAEQLTGLSESMPDLFVAPQQPPEPEPDKPQFGAPVQGKMPTGTAKPTFGDAWGFVPPKKS